MFQRDSKLGKFDVPLKFNGERSTWYRPVSIDQLVILKKEIPNLKLVTGNTEIGVESNTLGRHNENLCYIADIKDLTKVHANNLGIKLKTIA